ncbi:NUMOD4 [Hexamita inflata]|uniref:NUMOD4 n=1 Tax=Hexamita inflata TaxID=28002 RepID=A0AA86TB46_9EUKA|nr:NUMOD4 [Hexamita inflata]
MQTKHDISNIESISSIESFSESFSESIDDNHKSIFDQSRSYSIEQTLNDYKQGEQFKYIKEYPSYLISNYGRITFNEDKVKRAPISITCGYYQVSIQNEFGSDLKFINLQQKHFLENVQKIMKLIIQIETDKIINYQIQDTLQEVKIQKIDQVIKDIQLNTQMFFQILV